MRESYAYVDVPAGTTLRRGDSLLFNRLKRVDAGDVARYDEIVGATYGGRPFLFFAAGDAADSTVEMGRYGRTVPFETTRDLRLLDLTDPGTLSSLSRSFERSDALLDVYRLRDGRVKRRSRYEPDMEVTDLICNMGFDGTAFLSGHGIPPEVVLCRPSDKVRLDASSFDDRYRSQSLGAPDVTRQKLFVKADVLGRGSSDRNERRNQERRNRERRNRERRYRDDASGPSDLPDLSSLSGSPVLDPSPRPRAVRRLFAGDEPPPLPLFD